MNAPSASPVAVRSAPAATGPRSVGVDAGAVPDSTERGVARNGGAPAGAGDVASRPGPSGGGAASAGGDAAGAVDAVDALLPQTQCRRCGYDACRPYAEALVRGKADINRCPPGGEPTVVALAGVLGRPVVALDPACGIAGPRQTARIDESACIGCTICIRACPVDAIIGARKWMHAVLDTECTGCGLCVEPCPVDCIAMVAPRTGPVTAEAWLAERAPHARRRFERRQAREAARDAAPHRRERAGRIDAVESLRRRTVEQRRADIAAAVARVAARKSGVVAMPAAVRPTGREPHRMSARGAGAMAGEAEGAR